MFVNVQLQVLQEMQPTNNFPKSKKNKLKSQFRTSSSILNCSDFVLHANFITQRALKMLSYIDRKCRHVTKDQCLLKVYNAFFQESTDFWNYCMYRNLNDFYINRLHTKCTKILLILYNRFRRGVIPEIHFIH